MKKKAMHLADLQEYNENHDERGRFASKDGGGSSGGSEVMHSREHNSDLKAKIYVDEKEQQMVIENGMSWSVRGSASDMQELSKELHSAVDAGKSGGVSNLKVMVKPSFKGDSEEVESILLEKGSSWSQRLSPEEATEFATKIEKVAGGSSYKRLPAESFIRPLNPQKESRYKSNKDNSSFGKMQQSIKMLRERQEKRGY